MDAKPSSSSSSSSSSTNSIIIDDKQDILMEILLRLPPKPLIRFKLVSKRWLFLISSHQFSRLHTLRHPKSQPVGLLLTTYSSPKQHFFYFHPTKKLIPYHFPSFLTRNEILSSSNGLILLQRDNQYFVYNPTTRESRNVPLSPTTTKNGNHILSLDLAFDPSISPHYKIICIRESSTRKSKKYMHRSCQVEAYDSETQSWKLCLESFVVSRDMSFACGLHLENIIYWGKSSYYYDIGKNEIGKLPDVRMPPGSGGVYYSRIRESNGRLHWPFKVCGFSETSMVVLVLDEDRSRWLFKYRAVIDPMYEHESFDVVSYFEEEGEGRTGVVLFQLPDKLITCRLRDWRYDEIVDFKDEMFGRNRDSSDDGMFEDSGVHHFVQSLVPV